MVKSQNKLYTYIYLYSLSRSFTLTLPHILIDWGGELSSSHQNPLKELKNPKIYVFLLQSPKNTPPFLNYLFLNFPIFFNQWKSWLKCQPLNHLICLIQALPVDSCFSRSVKWGASTMEMGLKSLFWIQKGWKAKIWTEYLFDLVFYPIRLQLHSASL